MLLGKKNIVDIDGYSDIIMSERFLIFWITTCSNTVAYLTAILNSLRPSDAYMHQ